MIKKRNKKINKIMLYAVCTLLFISCGFLYSCTSQRGNVYLVEEKAQTASGQETDNQDNMNGIGYNNETDAAPEEITQDKLFVYVCGNVVNPGVYEAYENSRVYELIEMAGGVTDEGCLEALNLAEHIYDGQKLYVPDYEEYESNGSIFYASGETAGSGKVDINKADLELLMTLPGIGQSRAQAIIDYRDTNGRFGCIEDIMGVSGIKESAFSKIKDYICVN